MKKKGFTLIELIAVLVILAILALIVTPLVMNIIRKARISADKRSIDAYGRSIELAIATYLLDNGDFPTSINDLTIEYSGDEVVCSTTQLNSDSSVYLTGCAVAGRNVDYSYGSEKSSQTNISYTVGDEVTYNNVDYYVIKDSSENESFVSLLKAEPITSNEISPYLASTEIGISVNTSDKYASIYYYYASECATSGHLSGCTTDYGVSSIKQAVDIWVNNYTNLNDLVEDSMGYKSRLITKDEIMSLCELDEYQATPSNTDIRCIPQYEWIFIPETWYWTMTPYQDSSESVWVILDYNIASMYDNANYSNSKLIYGGGKARPVITVKKSALQ